MCDGHDVNWEEMTTDQKLEALRNEFTTLHAAVARLKDRQAKDEIDVHNRLRNIEARLWSQA
jgi:hypothetical protein